MFFRKQSSINACKRGFLQLRKFGYEFGVFGFAGIHLHFSANVPEQYSIMTAKTMLKSWSARNICLSRKNSNTRTFCLENSKKPTNQLENPTALQESTNFLPYSKTSFQFSFSNA
jgi:hypothetical protein